MKRETLDFMIGTIYFIAVLFSHFVIGGWKAGGAL